MYSLTFRLALAVLIGTFMIVLLLSLFSGLGPSVEESTGNVSAARIIAMEKTATLLQR
jgi:hypothetical protein